MKATKTKYRRRKIKKAKKLNDNLIKDNFHFALGEVGSAEEVASNTNPIEQLNIDN